MRPAQAQPWDQCKYHFYKMNLALHIAEDMQTVVRLQSEQWQSVDASQISWKKSSRPRPPLIKMAMAQLDGKLMGCASKEGKDI